MSDLTSAISSLTPLGILQNCEKNCRDMANVLTAFELHSGIKIAFADPLNKTFYFDTHSGFDEKTLAGKIRATLDALSMHPTNWMAVPTGSMFQWDIHASGYQFSIRWVAGTPIALDL
jgi:hypothetical protein